MRTLDLWRKEVGLEYPQERAERQTEPTGGSLHAQQGAVRYGSIAGVHNQAGELKQISQLVMGTMLEGSINPLTHGLALFDDFYERGGTCFDSAYVYMGGRGEKVLGHWLGSRGVRDDVTIIAKGAHTPFCNPEALVRQLDESLGRLGLPYADIYMLHRDNPDVPVGEFVDVLNQQKQAGKIGVFGGSNWSLARLEEGNVYARKNGLQGFSVVSNNFSLARMVEPVWEGCVSSSDAASREWLQTHGLALFSWSSQARGFFARGDKDFQGDAELTRCWYSDDNFERLERARELARQKDVSPVVIAAAYVLEQPFPLFGLIGPRTLAETRDSFRAFDVRLTGDEMSWLNLEI
jgi:aryl-alcohol dehydrogenase-like predicted oxidoreductase